MRAEFSRRLFLLAAPGTEGYENPRPVRPGILTGRSGYPGENRLAETLFLFFPKGEAVSPGDALFDPAVSSLDTPAYLIREVTAWPDHTEAAADRFPRE